MIEPMSRERVMSVRVTEDERRTLALAAKRSGMDVSSFVRAVALDAARKNIMVREHRVVEVE